MSYLSYLCLLAHSGVQHIMCCDFVLLSSSCAPFIASFFGLSIASSVFSNVYLVRQVTKLTPMYDTQMDQTSSDTKSSLSLWPGEHKNAR